MVKQLTRQDKDKISDMEEKRNSKFCSDYFIPVGALRTMDPYTC